MAICEINSEKALQLVGSIPDFRLSISRDGTSAYAAYAYSAWVFTKAVYSSGHESILSQQIMTSVT